MKKKSLSQNSAAHRKKERGITAIAVCGYKSLNHEQRIEIRPLTILAGANSSGKSSILQPLLLLKQTLETPYDPGALLLNGPNVRATSADQLLSKITTKECSDSFHVQFENLDNWKMKLSYKREQGKAIDIESIIFYEKGEENEKILHMGMSHDEIMTIIPGHLKDFYKQIEKQEKNIKWIIRRERCFLSLILQKQEGSKLLSFGGGFFPSPFRSFVERDIVRVIHLPGLRGNPERTYKTTAVGDEFPGTFENYVASLVNHWQNSGSDKLKLLGKALEDLGLTWKVEAKPVDDTQVELRVGRLLHGRKGGSHDLVSIADVGFGVSQTLPVVVALLVAKPGQIVYLEQPEIHLHPRAQYAMAKLLVDAANRGVKVIIETHSDILLVGIQALVAEGKLSSDKVKLHWFSRSLNGFTEVKSADLDEAGAFGDWPEDFAEVYLKAESRYLDAAEARRGKK